MSKEQNILRDLSALVDRWNRDYALTWLSGHKDGRCTELGLRINQLSDVCKKYDPEFNAPNHGAEHNDSGKAKL